MIKGAKPASTKAKSAGATRKKFGIDRGKDAFPIVGIGASAGGLEAGVDFFSYIPADSLENTR